VAWWETG